MRRLLLTSAGVSNATIHDALLDLLGRPIEDCTALRIPTAMYGHPHAGPGENVWEFVAGRSQQPMVELGWKSVGLIELTALPSIGEEQLDDTVWVGMSAGSMVTTPRIGKESWGGSRPSATTERSVSSTSRSSLTSTTSRCLTTRWLAQQHGLRDSTVPRTRSTTRPPSASSTATSRSCRRGTGIGSMRDSRQNEGCARRSSRSCPVGDARGS
jgi:hypothetical protein